MQNKRAERQHRVNNNIKQNTGVKVKQNKQTNKKNASARSHVSGAAILLRLFIIIIIHKTNEEK